MKRISFVVADCYEKQALEQAQLLGINVNSEEEQTEEDKEE